MSKFWHWGQWIKCSFMHEWSMIWFQYQLVNCRGQIGVPNDIFQNSLWLMVLWWNWCQTQIFSHHIFTWRLPGMTFLYLFLSKVTMLREINWLGFYFPKIIPSVVLLTLCPMSRGPISCYYFIDLSFFVWHLEMV